MVLKEHEITNETELEEILINNPSLIEDDFKLLKSQRKTTPYRKRLDLLGVDSQGTLTVVELKAKEDSGQLLQALEYFDWLLERGLSFFRDYFSESIENLTPRIILVAPEFSEKTIKACKYISEDVQVTLKKIIFSYEIAGNKFVKLMDVKIPSRTEIEQPPPKIEDHINYIKDENIKNVFKETINMIMNLEPGNVRYTILPYRINFIHKSRGLKFAELYRRQRYFYLTWKEDSEWYQTKIESLEEAKESVNSDVKNSMKDVK